MAEPVNPQDLLQPALLDRLTDDQPDKTIEPRHERVMSKRELREAVLRDLTWLFNTARMERGTELRRYPLVQHSVVNFGLPALAGERASSIEVVELERGVRQSILDFEPRILPATLRVKAVEVAAHNRHNVIGVQISGQLWAQPLPIEFLVRTEIDLETGRVEMADLGATRVA